MQYKKTLVTVLGALILAVLVSHNLAFAANLGQAASTLPGNDEWAIMARAALGQTSGESFLAQPLNSNLATDYEKRILAITAIGRNPATIGSENFISKLENMFNGGQIGDPSLLNDDIFGLLALSSAGISNNVTAGARSYILAHQNSDGGWGYAVGVGSDSNTTGVAVAALRTTGSAPANAISYLQSSQSSSGGYGFTPGQAADGASTAWVIWGLAASGQQIPTAAIDFLNSLQLSNGSFKWRPNDSSGSALVTAYAVIALSGHTLPVNSITNPPPPTDTCQDPNATNFGGPLPCTYPPQARTNDATCINISVPPSVLVSNQFQASVTMRNTGTQTWSAGGYLLGSQNPQDNNRWSKTRVNLSTDVQPGQNFNFTFTATAPGVAGNFPFEWKMVQEFVQWFGSPCAANITVSSSPPPTNNPPVGVLDLVDCNIIGGWAFDPDNSPGLSVIEIFANGPEGTGTKIFSGLANTPRPDVNAAFNITGTHGFTISMPQSLKDGANHEIWVYVQDSSTHQNSLINHRTFDSSACVTPTQICEDHNATNFGGALPCRYPQPSGDYQVSISYPGNKIFDSTIASATTPLQALVIVAGQINLLYTIKQTGLGQFVESIDGYRPSGSSGWQYAVNGTIPQVGASDYTLKSGDRVQWFYGAPGTSPF